MLTKEHLQELEAQHQRIAHVVSASDDPKTGKPCFEFVLRKPTRAEYKQFRSRVNNESQKAEATEIMARQCVVYPSREAFDAMLEDWVMAADAASEHIMTLAGGRVRDDAK